MPFGGFSWHGWQIYHLCCESRLERLVNSLKVMTNREYTQQQVLGLSFAIFDNNMNSLINEINDAVKKSETPEWREQLECSLVLMQEIRERVSEAMIVIDEYERKPSIEERFINWLCAAWFKIIHNQ